MVRTQYVAILSGVQTATFYNALGACDGGSNPPLSIIAPVFWFNGQNQRS